jgi:serine/threonine-protein kinase
MSPEQTRGAKHVDEQTDQYSLGVMLYECATGRRPFGGQTPYDLMHAIVTAPLVSPRAHRPDLPVALEAIVLRAMRRDPGERFPSVEALGASLLPLASPRTRAIWGEHLAGVWVSERHDSGSDVAIRPRAPVAGSKRGLVALLCGSALALAAAGMVIGGRRGERSASSDSPMPATQAAAGIPEVQKVLNPEEPSPRSPDEPAPLAGAATLPTSAPGRRRLPRTPAPASPTPPSAQAPTGTISAAPPRLGANLAPILP